MTQRWTQRWMQRAARLALAGATLIALATTSSCGDPNQAYCDTLNQDRAKLADMTSSQSPSALIDALPTLRALGKQAPGDIAAQWQTLISAIDALNKALAAAGVKPADFQQDQTNLTDVQKQAIADAANGLSSAETSAATNAIDQQARDVCKTNIGM